MNTVWPLRDDESRRAFLRAEAASLEPEDEDEQDDELSEWDVNEDRYREDFRDRD